MTVRTQARPQEKLVALQVIESAHEKIECQPVVFITIFIKIYKMAPTKVNARKASEAEQSSKASKKSKKEEVEKVRWG